MSRRIGLFCCASVVLCFLLCTVFSESLLSELQAASPAARAGEQNPAIASAATSTGGSLQPVASRELASAVADIEPAVLFVLGMLLLTTGTAIKTVRSKKEKADVDRVSS